MPYAFFEFYIYHNFYRLSIEIKKNFSTKKVVYACEGKMG